MKEIKIKDLKVGEKVLFQLKNWSPSNLHFVEVLFVGKTYVVMWNAGREQEYCVKHNVFDGVYGDDVPKFYVSEERK
ncbi:hypothetical protein [Alteromonas phage PB15]|nr:hypothetical protein [Alteromonas phage PB15]